MTVREQIIDFTKFWSVPSLIITVITLGAGIIPMFAFWLAGVWIVYYNSKRDW